jgi:uncharacterized protein YndB with AHSA1/START domain
MLTVSITTNENPEKVWDYFTQPEHIVNWNFASDDWHCPAAENDLKVGNSFKYTMASKDGEMSFDFIGTYSEIQLHKKIAYTIADGRKVIVTFENSDGKLTINETFEPENIHSLEMQQGGWQTILDNFKKYLEQ